MLIQYVVCTACVLQAALNLKTVIMLRNAFIRPVRRNRDVR